jgi:hypothetical protein
LIDPADAQSSGMIKLALIKITGERAFTQELAYGNAKKRYKSVLKTLIDYRCDNEKKTIKWGQHLGIIA